MISDLLKDWLQKVDGKKSNVVAGIAGSAGLLDIVSGNPESGMYSALAGAAVYALRDSMRKVLSAVRAFHERFEQLKELEARMEEATRRLEKAIDSQPK